MVEQLACGSRTRARRIVGGFTAVAKQRFGPQFAQFDGDG